MARRTNKTDHVLNLLSTGSKKGGKEEQDAPPVQLHKPGAKADSGSEQKAADLPDLPENYESAPAEDLPDLPEGQAKTTKQEPLPDIPEVSVVHAEGEENPIADAVKESLEAELEAYLEEEAAEAAPPDGGEEAQGLPDLPDLPDKTEFAEEPASQIPDLPEDLPQSSAPAPQEPEPEPQPAAEEIPAAAPLSDEPDMRASRQPDLPDLPDLPGKEDSAPEPASELPDLPDLPPVQTAEAPEPETPPQAEPVAAEPAPKAPEPAAPAAAEPAPKAPEPEKTEPAEVPDPAIQSLVEDALKADARHQAEEEAAAREPEQKAEPLKTPPEAAPPKQEEAPRPAPEPQPQPKEEPQSVAQAAAAVPSEPGDTEEQKDYAVVNVMEHLVRNQATNYIQQFGHCDCGRCVEDTIALALTHLPAKYVVVNKNAVSPLLHFYEKKFAGQLIVEITKASMIVNEIPHHNR